MVFDALTAKGERRRYVVVGESAMVDPRRIVVTVFTKRRIFARLSKV